MDIPAMFALVLWHVAVAFPSDLCVEPWPCDSSDTWCRNASQLVGRLHDLDPSPNYTLTRFLWGNLKMFLSDEATDELGIPEVERNLKFPEPSEVRELCLAFLRLPTGPAKLERHLSQCSRAMLTLATLADVVDVELGDSCSEEQIKARYPLTLEDEERYDHLLDSRFVPIYARYVVFISKWKLLTMLSNHTQMCSNQGFRCAAFNPWEPQRCFEHHELVRRWSPSCHGRPQIQTPPWRDWLGLRIDAGGCGQNVPQGQTELTRHLECNGLAWGPLPGEDYFETISLLHAVSIAKGGRFVVVEAGSGNGYWGLKAAKAFRQRYPSRFEGSCDVILIDSDYPMTKAAALLSQQHIYGLCNVSLYQEPATPLWLAQILQAYGRIDLLHVDIQFAELELITESSDLSLLRTVHIGTHNRPIHRAVKADLRHKGFAIDADYPPRSFVRTAYGPVPFCDGMLAASRDN